MQAVINMTAEGTRLRPLSCNKCVGMLNVGDESVAERLVRQLAQSGTDEVVVFVGYMPYDLYARLGDGEKWGIKIRYASEAFGDGALKRHGDILRDEFVYISKPIYTNIDFKRVFELHKKRNAYVSVVDKNAKNRIVCDKDGRITRLEEKRLWHSVSGETGGSGIYVMKRDATAFFPEESDTDIFENVLPSLVRAGKEIYVARTEGFCESINDFASYMRANFEFSESLKKQNKKGIVICEGAFVEKGAVLEGPCHIGKHARICKGAKIGAYSIVGNGAQIKEGANVKRSVVGEFARIGTDCVLRGAIIDANAVLGKNVTVFEQGVVGFGTSIENNCTVKSFVKIWPEKHIGEGATVSENIMWGQKKRQRLYNRGVIDGIVNVDITPKFCTVLGEAVGTLFEMGEVGVSSDGSAIGLMIRDGIVAGLAGTGSKVKDFGEQPLPITRRGVAYYALKGAVDINVYEKDGEEVAEITVLESDGTDIDAKTKKRLEDCFQKGEYAYPSGREIAECEYLFEYKLYYLKALVGYEKKTGKAKKILVSCGAKWGRRLIASAMADFGCAVSMYIPYADDSKKAAARFAEAVECGGFDMGFILDPSCEKVKAVLPGKRIVEDDLYEAMTMLIVMKKYKNAKIYVPITSTDIVTELAKKYECETVVTKNAQAGLMKMMNTGDKATEEQFVFRFDAVGSVIKLMDFFADNSVESLLTEIPPIRMAKEVVAVPKEKIDEAMRRIREIKGAEEKGEEGVKITLDKGWVVVVPDVYKEVCRVVSEGANTECARELCDFCASRLKKEI